MKCRQLPPPLPQTPTDHFLVWGYEGLWKDLRNVECLDSKVWWSRVRKFLNFCANAGLAFLIGRSSYTWVWSVLDPLARYYSLLDQHPIYIKGLNIKLAWAPTFSSIVNIGHGSMLCSRPDLSQTMTARSPPPIPVAMVADDKNLSVMNSLQTMVAKPQ